MGTVGTGRVGEEEREGEERTHQLRERREGEEREGGVGEQLFNGK